MIFKIIGALFVLVGCGGFGFKIAINHRYEERTLRRFLSILDHLECELKCRLTPLPELCNIIAASTEGPLQQLFLNLNRELKCNISPNVEVCMDTALSRTKDIPRLTADALKQLSRSLGQFDTDGQLKEINAVRLECQRVLENYTRNQDARLQSYQTLGLCAGAALAILFI